MNHLDYATPEPRRRAAWHFAMIVAGVGVSCVAWMKAASAERGMFDEERMMIPILIFSGFVISIVLIKHAIAARSIPARMLFAGCLVVMYVLLAWATLIYLHSR
jgi:hypothetical protein